MNQISFHCLIIIICTFIDIYWTVKLLFVINFFTATFLNKNETFLKICCWMKLFTSPSCGLDTGRSHKIFRSCAILFIYFGHQYFVLFCEIHIFENKIVCYNSTRQFFFICQTFNMLSFIYVINKLNAHRKMIKFIYIIFILLVCFILIGFSGIWW